MSNAVLWSRYKDNNGKRKKVMVPDFFLIVIISTDLLVTDGRPDHKWKTIKEQHFKIQNSFISSRPNTNTFETSSLSVCSDSTNGSEGSFYREEAGKNFFLMAFS
ncbi:jg10151 [Pararge aegeria aegeria]|uniref:Jg10151 protein n=1 Tax=Pararge aegeria aegeria TaxID=348720 RepID=A0A8S4R785_9NEOP|nr:jg10151 [Pararge aegeria aegeria]